MEEKDRKKRRKTRFSRTFCPTVWLSYLSFTWTTHSNYNPQMPDIRPDIHLLSLNWICSWNRKFLSPPPNFIWHVVPFRGGVRMTWNCQRLLGTQLQISLQEFSSKFLVTWELLMFYMWPPHFIWRVMPLGGFDQPGNFRDCWGLNYGLACKISAQKAVHSYWFIISPPFYMTCYAIRGESDQPDT